MTNISKNASEKRLEAYFFRNTVECEEIIENATGNSAHDHLVFTIRLHSRIQGAHVSPIVNILMKSSSQSHASFFFAMRN